MSSVFVRYFSAVLGHGTCTNNLYPPNINVYRLYTFMYTSFAKVYTVLGRSRAALYYLYIFFV